mmetsp:Transcript_16520/g.64494  ORF Transcript_16520/g.64494 Transcript_16520/m.64494 type:complete len:210 (-) Transcript_16520:162-791(-)
MSVTALCAALAAVCTRPMSSSTPATYASSTAVLARVSFLPPLRRASSVVLAAVRRRSSVRRCRWIASPAPHAAAPASSNRFLTVLRWLIASSTSLSPTVVIAAWHCAWAAAAAFSSRACSMAAAVRLSSSSFLSSSWRKNATAALPCSIAGLAWPRTSSSKATAATRVACTSAASADTICSFAVAVGTLLSSCLLHCNVATLLRNASGG